MEDPDIRQEAREDIASEYVLCSQTDWLQIPALLTRPVTSGK